MARTPGTTASPLQGAEALLGLLTSHLRYRAQPSHPSPGTGSSVEARSSWAAARSWCELLWFEGIRGFSVSLQLFPAAVSNPTQPILRWRMVVAVLITRALSRAGLVAGLGAQGAAQGQL